MSPEAATALVQYGALGVVVLLFVFGQIVAKPTIDRERLLTDRAIENNARMAEALDRLSDTVLRGPGA